ncbi:MULTISPECIES: TerD family protein [unclassified Streptomyces]|uniref:TerD family protein n=1 Tax=unclassified Streptomyces TaxID=2593676 RepID=UPI0033E62347
MTTAAPITLTKDMGAADLPGVTRLAIGASWDATSGGEGGIVGWAKRKRGCDLDAIAVLMQDGEPVRLAGLDSLDPIQNGSVVHSGDNQTGHGDGDDETVTVDFPKVPGNVDAIVFVCAAFKKGSAFDKAMNVSFKVYDASDGVPGIVADIWPSLLGAGNACAVAKAVRGPGGWTLEVVNKRGTIRQGDQTSLLRFAIGM